MSNPVNDTTKPSRINRKKKRRWKIASLADLLKAGLTDCYRVAILCPLSSKMVKAGLGLLEIHGAYRHQSGFFTRKISALHIMSGWAGTRKGGRVVCPVVQPAQSGTMFGFMLSGLKPFTRSQS
jgi:hypothetical protein